MEGEVRDKMNVLEKIKFLIDNSFYQNSETPRGTFFITYEDLEELPGKIVDIVDNSQLWETDKDN